MTHPLKTPQAHTMALLLARVPIGVFFLMAGYLKVAKTGSTSFVSAYRPIANQYMSPALAGTFLHVLPYMEMLIGTALIIGFYTRVAASLAAMLLISFMIAVTGIAFDASGNHPPLSANVVFLGLMLLLMTTGGGEMAVDETLGKSGGPPSKK